MFNPKKTIPKLAVALLALTGCGGDGGGGTGGTGTAGNGGNGGAGGGAAGTGGMGTAGNGGAGGGAADFDTRLTAFCMNAAPCFDYTALSCINYYNAVNSYNDNAQCTAAQITYFDCGATKTCNQLLQGACDSEYYALWAVCDEVP